jgi:hypothetical protein
MEKKEGRLKREICSHNEWLILWKPPFKREEQRAVRRAANANDAHFDGFCPAI